METKLLEGEQLFKEGRRQEAEALFLDILEAEPGHTTTWRLWSWPDVAVPLFCALGEFEYGAQLCLDAMDCDWRDEKFMAWCRAIIEVGKLSMPLYKDLPETENLVRETSLRRKQLRRSNALLEEYNAQLTEANALNVAV